MRVNKNISARNHRGRKSERGVIITLVAVFVLFVLGAMAALSIDVVTLYTARSEAQLAADGAALAGARVLANSGMTSDPNAASDGLQSSAETFAGTVATQVATGNSVGGTALNAGQVTVTFNNASVTNPRITVKIQKTNLSTFFARIWGRTQVTVGALATAEAYNPSAANGGVATDPGGPPVAPVCVKPWLLPNIDPTGLTPNAIFTESGAINYPPLLGQTWPTTPTTTNGLYARCSDCSAGGGGILAPLPGAYYPGAIDADDFPAPAASACPNCTNGFNPYQLAVAGCVQQPISCGANPNLNIDTTAYGPNRDADTVQAAECLTHYGGAGTSDSIDTSDPPSPPFQFLGGSENPVVGAINQPVLVSDSLVTLPVINSPPGTPANPVTVIGFVQVLLNPQSTTLPTTGPQGTNQIPAMIINMAGCGTSTTGQPILGNGASPVAVRLISP